MDILVVKILCLAGIFFITMLCCFLPLKFLGKKKGSVVSYRYQRLLSYCNCLAGGVFIGTCFLGLVPNVRNIFDKAKAENPGLDHVPLTEVTLLLGFFVILFIEQLVHTVQESKHAACSPGYDNHREPGSIQLDGYTASESDCDSEQDPCASENHELFNGSVRPQKKKEKVQKTQGHGGHSHEVHGGHEGHSHLGDISKSDSLISVLILLLALGSHGVFEGMALGLQTRIDNFVRLTVAVMAHECLCSLAIGLTLAQQQLKMCTTLKIAITFCSLIPIGMVIGMALGTVQGYVGHMVSGVIQGIAAGTFIHVIFFEILPPEFGPKFGRLWKVLFLAIGCAVMGALAFVHHHEDEAIEGTNKIHSG